jgi:hypothetical protein
MAIVGTFWDRDDPSRGVQQPSIVRASFAFHPCWTTATGGPE